MHPLLMISLVPFTRALPKTGLRVRL